MSQLAKVGSYTDLNSAVERIMLAMRSEKDMDTLEQKLSKYRPIHLKRLMDVVDKGLDKSVEMNG